MQTLAIALIICALLTGLVSYVYLQRYGSARALEMGTPPHIARSGPIDDGGATAYDRRISMEILQGTYETQSRETRALGRLARRWTLSSIALCLAAIAVLASSA